MITWMDETLCVDKDLIDLESSALEWVSAKGSAAAYRATAKKIITSRLRSHFRSEAVLISGSEVLDLIADTEPLRQAATYLTLHLVCNDCSTGGDLFDKKAQMYWGKYNEEWPYALGQLSLDRDESGAIDASEEFNVSGGVTFTR